MDERLVDAFAKLISGKARAWGERRHYYRCPACGAKLLRMENWRYICTRYSCPNADRVRTWEDLNNATNAN
jgi:predicted RNA-binding Zn-ribbon protein involved in translation (DUF1610 family)